MRARKLTAALAAVPVILTGTAGVAHADNIQDTITDTGGSVVLEAGSATAGTAAIKVVGNNADGATTDPGCNWDSGELPLVLDVVTPAGVTATPDPVSITQCGTDVPVRFTASAAAVSGVATVSITSTPAGGGGYNNQVSIPITVTQPATTNTPPEVSVTGVTDGETYTVSGVQKPDCLVVDAEDADESATPQVSNGAYDALGEHTVTCSYTDGGQPALTRTATATYTVTRDPDGTPPVIDYTLNGELGSNDWYVSDVTLEWLVSDPDSDLSVVDGCEDQYVSQDQDSTGYTCTAESGGGTTGPVTVSIKRDATAPVVSETTSIVSGTPGLAGWYRSAVEVEFTANDATSGPATDSEIVSSVGEGELVTVASPEFTDLAGNTVAAGAVERTVKIDSQAPNAPTVLIDPETSAAWHNRDVVVSFVSAGDNGDSGVVGCTDDITVSEEGADQVVSGTCTDAAGNTSEPATVTVNLDKSGPVVSEVVQVEGTRGEDGWYTSDVEVTFTATDDLAGPESQTKSVTSPGEGAAVDVASPEFIDTAGNVTPEGAVVKTYKIDRTAPSEPTFTGLPDSSFYFGSTVSMPTCESEDPVSGATCAVTLTNAGDDPAAVGSHTFTATATNGAGLTSTSTFTYTVLAWTTKGFYSPVDMNGVWNTVKGGSTVPLKFEVFKGADELTSTAGVKGFSTKPVTCPGASAPADAIEFVTTGGTALRYDATAGQFIQNWQTPKRPGSCYEVTLTTQDDSTLTARFILK